MRKRSAEQSQQSIGVIKKPTLAIGSDNHNLAIESESNSQEGKENGRQLLQDNDKEFASMQRTDTNNDWFIVLERQFKSEYYAKLKRFLTSRAKAIAIFPPPSDVYNAFNYCRPDQVKVVILGQDPYHNDGQAHGLCFSVPKGVKPPPSLANIFKELTVDISGFTRPDHGCLEGWAKQGVLLLNAVLTVEAHKANSHAGKGWEKFTDAVIKHISQTITGVVFMLWGQYAQKKAECIQRKSGVLLLKAAHPSPLSAHQGFLGCKHFSKANQFLIENDREPIDWAAI